MHDKSQHLLIVKCLCILGMEVNFIPQMILRILRIRREIYKLRQRNYNTSN